MEMSASSVVNAARPLQLWVARPDDLLEKQAAQACAALLNDDERTRWQRYRMEDSRREYLATHAMARMALSHAHSTAAEAWSFTANVHGKPMIEPECGLRFNLTNAHGLVACLVADGAEVGVDLEPIARGARILPLAREVFSASECEQLTALSHEEQKERAVSLWTLKEAYIKARGMGLRLPLRGISFLFDEAQGIHLQLDAELEDAAERWRFALLDHAGHRIAMMTEQAAGVTLEMWEARPPVAPPFRVACAVQWFPRS